MRPSNRSAHDDPHASAEAAPPPRWLAWLVVAWVVVCGMAYAHATLAVRFPGLAARLFGR